MSFSDLDDSAPLVSALAQAAQRDHTAFYTPGHKGGQGIAPPLATLLGTQVFRADLPELPELDNLFAPEGPILEAQALAAETFGADATFFLINGSTCGIQAAILAVCSPGDKILVPRNAHQSVLSALVLAGASPIFAAPIHHPDWDLAYGLSPEQVATAFEQYPDLQAVIIVSPNYQGVCSDIGAIAATVHAQSCILIVDEAHGPHLCFHDQLPEDALSGGADLVIQSTHKVLSALTQASMLHVQGPRVARDRLRQSLQLTQSTSPSYLLLASLDATRQQMAAAGHDLLERTLAITQSVRSRLATLTPLKSLTGNSLTTVSPHFQLDTTRLTVDVAALGLTGFAADEHLHKQLGVTAELPTLRQLAFIVSLGNTLADGDRLVDALTKLVEQSNPFTIETQSHAPLPPTTPAHTFDQPMLTGPCLSPRAAFFAKSRTVAAAQSIGQIAADGICPYPPGIPVLLPGEVITTDAIAYLHQIQTAGGIITGNPDPTLQTLRIVDMP